MEIATFISQLFVFLAILSLYLAILTFFSENCEGKKDRTMTYKLV